MTKILKILLKIPVLIFRLAYLAAALTLIGGVGYFFGLSFLRAIYGTDTIHALSLVSWVNRYFPKMPFWYHLQGAGVSMKWNYPFLASNLVVIIDRLAHLGLPGSFQVLTFSSFLLTAVGMYFFVWLCLKNQTAALISAIFFLLMPLTYAWIMDWGFYAETIAYMFFFPPLIFYDFFLGGFLEGKLNFGHRLSLFLAAFFLVLLFNTHPAMFSALVFVIGIQAFFQALWQVKKKRKKPRRFLLKAFSPVLITVLSGILLMAFVIFNFFYYSKLTKNFGTQPAPPLAREESLENFVLNHSMPREAILGVGSIPDDHFQFSLRNVKIPPLVWIAALAGLVLTLIFDRKVFAYILPSFFGFGVILYPNAFLDIVRLILKLPVPRIVDFFGLRVYTARIRFFFPIAAAFGIVGVGRLLFEIPTFWYRFIKNKYLTAGVTFIRNFLVAVFALAAFVYLVFYAADKPEDLYPWHKAQYGYWGYDIRDPFKKFKTPKDELSFENRLVNLRVGCKVLLENGQSAQVCQSWSVYYPIEKEITPQDKIIVDEFEKKCQLLTLPFPEAQLCPLVMTDKLNLYRAMLYSLKDLSYWPRPKLIPPEMYRQQVFPFGYYYDFVKSVAGEKNLRVDVSPKSGGITMGLNAVSEMSMVNIYTVTASLLGPYFGHQQQVFFTENDGREETASEMARWLGTKYLLVNPGADPTEKYFQRGEWELAVGDQEGNPAVLKFKDAPEMATWTKDKPTILVIGSKQNRVFEPLFRASNKGALPYDDAWLVEGEERIDDYSLEELKKFDILFLFGYHYKSRRRAWKLVDNYLRDGGKVFLSTGWQFVDQDWETEVPPAWFPPASLCWTDKFNQQSTYNFDLSLVGGEMDTSEFGPLEWNGVGYGVSVPESLRQWAKPVLSVDGVPLVAVGQYGQGKIVWSGLNLIGHMHSYGHNDSELLFFRRLFNWLQDSSQAVDLTSSLVLEREHPDRVAFTFNQNADGLSTLYWREASFPAWQAKLVKGKKATHTKIYYGGPRLMLMQLEDIQAGDRLILEFKPGLRNTVLVLISIFTFLGLLIYVILGKKLYQPVLTWLNSRFEKIKSKAKAAKEDWEKEEEY